MNMEKDIKEKVEKDLNDLTHMINVTYKIVKEPKLIITIIERLSKISLLLINECLKSSYQKKLISIIPKSKDAKIVLFEDRLMNKFKFSKKLIFIAKLLNKLNSITRSSMIVSKKDKIIIYKNNFSTEIFGINEAKERLNQLKEIYNEIKSMN